MNAPFSSSAPDSPPASPSIPAADCFHCGLPLPDAGQPQWQVEIDGVSRAMCCPGCQAVAQAIVGIGQSVYYRTRTGFAGTVDADSLVPPELALYDDTGFGAPFEGSAELCDAVLSVQGLRCAACVWLVEKRLARLPGIRAAHLNVATERLYVRWDKAQCQPSAIFQAVREVGYAAYPYEAERHGEQLRKAGKTLSRQLFVAGIGMMQVMMYALPAYVAADGTLEPAMKDLMRWASLLLTLPVVAYSALPFFKGAWASLRQRAPGMDVPVALGIGAAFVASVWATLTGGGEVYFDSVTMFVFLLLCSRYLELTARRKAAVAAERLRHALPASAARMKDFPVGRACEIVPAAQLSAGDVIFVKPGEAIAADGTIIEGDSAIDLSLLTGESAAQRRLCGELVPGGAINVDAAIVVRTTRASADSTLAELVKLVDRAGQDRPQMALWADKVAAWFVAALLLLTVAVFAFWQWHDAARAWPIAIALLVVSCPCALSLATPTVLAAATDRLLRDGVLVAQGHVLETLHRATHVVFDKTGTLTAGRPALRDVALFGALEHGACLDIAALLAGSSMHPLGRAIGAAARAARQGMPAGEGAQDAAGVARGLEKIVENLIETPGRGLEGTLDGVRYRLGNAAFVREISGAALVASVDSVATSVYLGRQCLGREDAGAWLARFRLQDPVRADAPEVVRYFQSCGKTVVLLSGDEAALTQAVGASLGIADARGGRLPAEKLACIQALQNDGFVVAMVGDGINDAAAMRAADVSFAMRDGAALAQARADAVLLSGRLSSIVDCARVAGKTMAVIRQNLLWASLYNLIAIPAAAAGWLNPWLSGAGMALSSAIVVGNALRVRRA